MVAGVGVENDPATNESGGKDLIRSDHLIKKRHFETIDYFASFRSVATHTHLH